jgi:hypothetical protein
VSKEKNLQIFCQTYTLGGTNSGSLTYIAAMIRENRQLVTDEPVEFKKYLVEGLGV